MSSGRGGVEFEDITTGVGASAVKGSTVDVEYSICLNHGESVQNAVPYSFQLGGRTVIAGLEYGIEGMRAGGVRRLRISPHLAYGEAGVPGTIPPNAVLDVHVRLLGVK